MKGIILYQSKYGATKKYATWLAEATGFEVKETKTARVEDLAPYDTIILGGGIYASGIAGLSFLKKNYGRIRDKRIIIFCTGASPYEEKSFEEVVAHNLKGELASIPCHYCRGAWDLESMNLVDRNLCKLLKKAVAKKNPDELETWEKALVAAGDGSADWTDRSYLEPILESLKL